MTTEWRWRLIVVVPDASLAAADGAAREINSTGPDYEGDAFTIPLSASGDAPVTHWGLYTSATDEMVAKMAASLPNIRDARFWRHDANGSLQASNVSAAAGQSWSFEQSLAAAGLSVIRPGDPTLKGSG